MDRGHHMSNASAASYITSIGLFVVDKLTRIQDSWNAVGLEGKVGILLAIFTAYVNYYYKRREDRRREKEQPIDNENPDKVPSALRSRFDRLGSSRRLEWLRKTSHSWRRAYQRLRFNNGRSR